MVVYLVLYVSSTQVIMQLHSLLHLCTQLWDKLEESIQLSSSIFEFKQKIQNIDLSELLACV